MRKKKYYLINVFSEHGYSFVVYTNGTEVEVLNKCGKNDLFKDKWDAFCASVVDADENDVHAFADCGCVYDI